MWLTSIHRLAKPRSYRPLWAHTGKFLGSKSCLESTEMRVKNDDMMAYLNAKYPYYMSYSSYFIKI